MADIVTGVRTYLAANGTVSGVVGTRIFPDVMPKGEALPAIVITETTRVSHEGLTGAAGLAQSRVQCRCYAATHIVAEALRTAVRNAIRQQVRGMMGEAIIRGATTAGQGVGYDPPQDGSDDYRWFKWIDFMISHVE